MDYTIQAVMIHTTITLIYGKNTTIRMVILETRGEYRRDQCSDPISFPSSASIYNPTQDLVDAYEADSTHLY